MARRSSSLVRHEPSTRLGHRRKDGSLRRLPRHFGKYGSLKVFTAKSIKEMLTLQVTLSSVPFTSNGGPRSDVAELLC